MKSPPPPFNDDGDDIFGPPRTCATGYCPPKNRPSMISPKYRQKEERRKVLKISVNKLKKIEDPEASLCRSVLINNTVRRLQREARDEKIQKQQLNYPRCYDSDNYLNIKSEFLKNELKCDEQPCILPKSDDFLEAGFDNSKLVDDISVLNTESAKNMDVLNSLEENLSAFSGFGSVECEKKRAYDDIEDCDVQDVLSQFYMPPTPRMLTSIDDDEDVNVVDEEPAAKKQKTYDEPESYARLEIDLGMDVDETKNITLNNNSHVINNNCHVISNNNNNNNNATDSESRLRYQNVDDSNSFTCGQASMFSEIQNHVFHNLIASLET